MSSFQKNIYQDLIADNQFVRWATGRDESGKKHWDEWKTKNPEYEHEFEEALKTARLFRFSETEIHETEIRYHWQKTQDSISNKNAGLKVGTVSLWVMRAAAVLVIPLLISVLWLYRENETVSSNYQQLSQQFEANPVTVKAPLGGMIEMELPDGTMAWLNAGSELKYHASFAKETREVSVNGEVYFDVKKGEAPFIVNNPGPRIKVYGTQFNVNAYENEENVTVALAEGEIALDVNHQEQFLKPGEISVFNKAHKALAIKQAPLDQFTSWRTGKLVFRDATLASITRTLERRYNARISISNNNLANYTYNAIIRGETFEQVLNLLSLSAPIKYSYKRPEQNADSSFTQAVVVISEDKNRIINH